MRKKDDCIYIDELAYKTDFSFLSVFGYIRLFSVFGKSTSVSICEKIAVSDFPFPFGFR